jgi:uncharacterized flavoprotein (TIGR03862 family)
MPEPRVPGLVVVGGGPAGLMAAEIARAAGHQVDLYESQGSVGRKFLIAGKGGLNLTHSEAFPAFLGRYRDRADEVGRWLRDFDADALRAWALGLGIETFVGSSGRVFPRDLKAAPLLRGWVRRLRESGVRFHVHHRCLGWDSEGRIGFRSPDGEHWRAAGATVLALGGGSWPQLGSDGAWVDWLTGSGVAVAPLMPANCGFEVAWSEHFASRYAGHPVKPAWLTVTGDDGVAQRHQGEFVISRHGIEGSLVYALSAQLREAIGREGQVRVELDLAPGRDLDRLRRELSRPRKGRSLSEFLRRNAGIEGVQAGLLHELVPREQLADLDTLLRCIKALPLVLTATRPIAEAISSAGGVMLEALDDRLMVRARPGVFCAGEMLDWEAPTGGYLLAASFASGRRAGLGAVQWLDARASP